jgi:hypothetical protein
MIPVFKPILKKKDIDAAYNTIKKGEISGTYSKSIDLLERNFAKYNKKNMLLVFLVVPQHYIWQ